MSEKVFLELDKTRYTWEYIDINTTRLNTTQIEDSDLSIGIISDKSIIKMKLELKVMFFDLGNTLIFRANQEEQFVNFAETDSILSNLKQKGIELGVISNGNRIELNNLLADPNLLNKFRVVVMSQDPEVGGIGKPKAKIFNIAIAKMSNILGFELYPMETAFLTEQVEHFKVYNFLYTSGLNQIIRNDCNAYIK